VNGALAAALGGPRLNFPRMTPAPSHGYLDVISSITRRQPSDIENNRNSSLIFSIKCSSHKIHAQ
jgi:hypothetical protein